MPDALKTPTTLAKRNAHLLVGSVVCTFLLLRFALHSSPNSDLTLGGYSVHHLFTGLVLIAIGGIPLAVFRGHTRRLDASLVVFGAGLGMALDEWVYLIATGGSNAEYLLPVSLWGGITVVGLACVYTLGLVALRGRSDESRGTEPRGDGRSEGGSARGGPTTLV